MISATCRRAVRIWSATRRTQALQLVGVLDPVPGPVPRDDETVRRPDAGLFLDQDEVHAHLGAMRVVDPPGGLPFLGDAALDDPVGPACEPVAAGIQVAAVQVERPPLPNPRRRRMPLPPKTSNRPTLRAAAAISQGVIG